MQDFKELIVWQGAMRLVNRCYEVTDGFPTPEKYGLRSQVRRSAVSIPSNIAEGCGRGTPKDFARFLQMAYSSACELETQIILSERLDLTEKEVAESLSDEIDGLRRQIAALMQKVSAAA